MPFTRLKVISKEKIKVFLDRRFNIMFRISSNVQAGCLSDYIKIEKCLKYFEIEFNIAPYAS